MEKRAKKKTMDREITSKQTTKITNYPVIPSILKPNAWTIKISKVQMKKNQFETKIFF